MFSWRLNALVTILSGFFFIACAPPTPEDDDPPPTNDIPPPEQDPEPYPPETPPPEEDPEPLPPAENPPPDDQEPEPPLDDDAPPPSEEAPELPDDDQRAQFGDLFDEMAELHDDMNDEYDGLHQSYADIDGELEPRITDLYDEMDRRAEQLLDEQQQFIDQHRDLIGLDTRSGADPRELQRAQDDEVIIDENGEVPTDDDSVDEQPIDQDDMYSALEEMMGEHYALANMHEQLAGMTLSDDNRENLAERHGTLADLHLKMSDVLEEMSNTNGTPIDDFRHDDEPDDDMTN